MKLGQAETVLLSSWKHDLCTIKQGGVFDRLDLVLAIFSVNRHSSAIIAVFAARLGLRNMQGLEQTRFPSTTWARHETCRQAQSLFHLGW